jgi:hypothetical protein
MLKLTVVALAGLAAASGHLLGQDIRTTSAIRAFQQDATRDDAEGVVKPVVLQSLSPLYTPEAVAALARQESVSSPHSFSETVTV